MVNPGAFRGTRKEFLMGEKAAYSAAMAGGYAADALALIQRRYFKRYPVDLPHSEEPSPEHLSAVEDEAPEPDIEEPDPDKLTPEEYAAAVEKIEHRHKIVQFRKAQIKRWMSYQYMKDTDLDPKESGANNPYRVLLQKLTGSEVGRPRRKTAVNVWRKTKRAVIEEKVKAQVGASRDQLATMRDKVARELFNNLSEAEKAHWTQQATKESDAALEAWKREMESGPSREAADRQRCIQGLVRYARPILEGIADATGWKVTLMAGGPEPAHEGKLNVISVHSGVTTGDVKMNFGRAERARYKKQVVPIFGSFLQKCYTPEECRARALPADEGFFPIDPADLEEDGATIDSVESLPSPLAASSPTLIGSKATSPSPSDPDVNTPPQIEPPATGQACQTEPRAAQIPPSRGPTPQPSPPRSLPPSRGPTPPLSPTRSRHGSPPAVDDTMPSTASANQAIPPSNASVPEPAQSPIQPVVTQSVVIAPPPAQEPAEPFVTPPAAPSSPSVPSLGGSPSNKANDESVATKDTEGHGLDAGKGKRGRKQGVAAAGADAEGNGDALNPKRVRTTRQRASIPTPASTPTSSTPTSSSPATSTGNPTITTPPDAPKWFENAVQMLEDQELGAQWAALLKSWMAFEVHQDFAEIGKLKSTHRPVCVKDWIQRHRSTTWRPSIIEVSDYQESFTKWWTSLQPDWRLSDGGIVFASVEGDWSDLRKPGLNGLFSVFAALFYWGLAVKTQNEGRDKWLVFVEDCRVACTQLLRSA